MNDREFELLDRIEENHWWFVGKRKILKALLARDPGLGPLPEGLGRTLLRA